MINKILTLFALHLGLAIVVAQPVITNQPQNQTVVVGSNATFSVGATGAPPLSYQWRSHANSLNYTNIPFGTEATLVLTNVQPTSRRFAVVVSDAGALAATSSPLAQLTVLLPPSFTQQPASQLAEVGDPTSISVTATGTPPLSYQWRFNGQTLVGQTQTNVVWTSAQLSNTGNYSVTITNIAGSITSEIATLTVVRPSFTKITMGPIVNDGGYSISSAWGDYDGDGFIDLFVANWGGNGINGGGFLYHNNGDGTFTRIVDRPPVDTTTWLTSATWGDYDNDGFIDLYVTTYDDSQFLPNRLYHNNGNGTFTLVTNIALAQQVQGSLAGVWGDFDNDGWLDLFVANGIRVNHAADGQALDDILYKNDHQGGFTRISFGTKPRGSNYSFSAAWGDFDNDGFLDLAVSQGGLPARQRALLYKNSRNGMLILVTNSAVSADVLNGEGCAWGDYDNDGWLDLCVGYFYGENNSLFHNNRDGTFTKITNSVVALDGGTTKGVAWGDYDNDGWLDLFVSNLGSFDQNGNWLGGKGTNFLYHNNGDGTFTKFTSAGLVKELGNCGGAVWGDYDNDGFLDLFVANGFFVESANNRLYRNNGNSNLWLNLRLVGTVSNRSAIGAKVRMLATIGGKTFWQLREISGGSSFGSQNDMRANFGLGNATNVDTVRIEWPSGTVQELHDVAPKQFLMITEPPRLLPSKTNGVPQFAIMGGRGFTYQIDTTTNLVDWSILGMVVVTNQNGTEPLTDINVIDTRERFYRALAR